MTPNGFGKRVRELRESAEIGSRELSAKLPARNGKPAGSSTISHIENGYTDSPRGEVVLALARLLGTSIEYLVEGIGKPPKPAAVRKAFDSFEAS